ncbi:TilS substrate-binding domain-containing protein [Pyruvatibacter sp.]|uniref:TilS substrate-binding domain-containing protein n=1 Tax=Pyruvatibacter sp. TaxID=1981328 RepID=UPI0032EE39C3
MQTIPHSKRRRVFHLWFGSLGPPNGLSAQRLSVVSQHRLSGPHGYFRSADH